MKNKKIMVWEIFRDPTVFDPLNNHLLSYSEDKTVFEKMEEESEHVYEGDIKHPMITRNAIPIKMMPCETGLFPIDLHSQVSNQFNLWVFHTNFKITEKIANILSLIDGIEALHFYTNYRGRLAVAKLFDFTDVRLNIEDKLEIDAQLPKLKISKENSLEQLLEIRKKIPRESIFWAIGIDSEEKYNVISSEIFDIDFFKKMNVLNRNSSSFYSYLDE